tara:strand:+ start:4927 stop:5994 length:1068 start_codon:yes stop_codon:yes gene_type:complete
MSQFSLPEHEQLKSLSIDGDFNSGNELSLKMNQTSLLARGEQDYILDMRESLLQTRTFFKYKVPEDWDLEWNFKIPPAATASSLPSLNSTDHEVVFYLKNEDWIKDGAGGWHTLEDAMNNFDFITSGTGSAPSVGAKGQNKYNPAVFDGSNDITFSGNLATSKLDIDATKDFIMACVISIADTDSVDTLFQIGAVNSNGFCRIDLDTSGTERKVNITTRASNTNAVCPINSLFTIDDVGILIVGSVNSSHVGRWNGTQITALGQTRRDIDGGSTNVTLGSGYTLLGDTNFCDVDLYESCFIVERPNSSANISATICEELEGYFAHKFKLTSKLPDNHAYKSVPPRISSMIDLTED